VDFFGSEQGKLVDFCENGNKTSDSINLGKFLTKIPFTF
jgi:hypothetical protein